jgi:hypothetical protein
MRTWKKARENSKKRRGNLSVFESWEWFTILLYEYVKYESNLPHFQLLNWMQLKYNLLETKETIKEIQKLQRISRSLDRILSLKKIQKLQEAVTFEH